MEKSADNLRVIIIGAGPIGLFLAHALTLANIDYIILERHPSVLSDYGQIIFTWPQSVRLLDQIGLFEKAQKVAIPLRAKKRIYGVSGEVLTTSRFWKDMEGNHGYPFLPILRPDLVKLLYSNLNDKETKVRTSSEVIDIETVPGGIRVHLKDGTVEAGSILIGADGVHSRARSAMQSSPQAQLQSDVSNPTPGKGKMTSTFHGIFGQASNKTLNIEDAVFFESRGAGTVIQCTATKNSIYFASLTRLPAPEEGSIPHRYNTEEMEQYAASIAHVRICPGVTFGDLWSHADKNRCRKLNQEEGLLERWHSGRIALVGDAAHKSTSVNGLGLTCGLHSAAALANELQGLLSSSSGSPRHVPSNSEIESAFARYQNTRYSEVDNIWEAGHAMVRETTSVSWGNWFWDRYILPWVDLEVLVWGFVVSIMLIRHGQVLGYVPFRGREGVVPWRRKGNVKA
ncbi:FAD/NAD(P)-binding domain-containing protein [Aspergillus filifer]